MQNLDERKATAALWWQNYKRTGCSTTRLAFGRTPVALFMPPAGTSFVRGRGKRDDLRVERHMIDKDKFCNRGRALDLHGPLGTFHAKLEDGVVAYH